MQPRNSRATRPADLGALAPLSDREIADLEGANGLLQFDRTVQLIGQALADEAFKLRPSTVLELNRLAVSGLEPTAGQYRVHEISISNTTHVPPPWVDVPRLVEDMCDYVNERWTEDDAVHLAAYTMWRLNWIHPFSNGNGRTSRVVSYLALCGCLGALLPGEKTVPDLIAADKYPYYLALDAADAAWKSGVLDVSVMERLIVEYLEVQLGS